MTYVEIALHALLFLSGYSGVVLIILFLGKGKINARAGK